MTIAHKYKFLEHPSDIKIKAYGDSLPEVLVNSAKGMMSYIYGKNQIKIDHVELIEINADNLESLLVNWLAKILALSSINHCVYVDFIIKKFQQNKIIAKISSGKAKAINEIKAVTFHDLSLKQEKSGWVATVVFDI